MTFETSYSEILKKIDQVDPVAYAKTRNYQHGDVTYLSPYISRGVISTKFVLDRILARGFQPYEIQKFIQELAWRDYWQQVWIAKGNAINQDLKHTQTDVAHWEIPSTLLHGKTGIHAIDEGIERLTTGGYVHNHMRMYLASVACNIAKSHWRTPAQWMYYHLLDGDWASNALSWQWVAGANANKKYFANQDNINTFFDSSQKDTFLDVEYDAFPEMQCPEALQETQLPVLVTPLPTSTSLTIDPQLPTLIYTYYNLDPLWKQGQQANRVLLLEPSIFKQYPVSQPCIDFVLKLKNNIPGLQVFVGEFDELKTAYSLEHIVFKEHPLTQHYQGVEENRDWIFNVQGFYPSFFAYWKRCKKEMKLWG